MKNKMSESEIRSILTHCHCSDNYYKHFLPSVIYTDGIKTMAEICEAHWLIDIIASHQTVKFKNSNEFQVWKLKKKPTKTHPNQFVAECTDGNQTLIIKQIIKYSDFPLDEIKIYVIDGIILLPSEY